METGDPSDPSIPLPAAAQFWPPWTHLRRCGCPRRSTKRTGPGPFTGRRSRARAGWRPSSRCPWGTHSGRVFSPLTLSCPGLLPPCWLGLALALLPGLLLSCRCALSDACCSHSPPEEEGCSGVSEALAGGRRAASLARKGTSPSATPPFWPVGQEGLPSHSQHCCFVPALIVPTSWPGGGFPWHRAALCLPPSPPGPRPACLFSVRRGTWNLPWQKPLRG